MKKHRLMRAPSLLLTIGIAGKLTAQCDFYPTIEQMDLILCPFTTAELSTQEFESYQWYKQGVPIPGATQRTLTVGYQMDAGFRFRVEATVNGCSAMSEEVLVDGWAFPPMVATCGGDSPLSVGSGGVLRYCQDDTGTLTLNHPYAANITWFRNGAPIAGAHSPVLIVSESGSYTAHAAPFQCPGLVFALDAGIAYEFEAPVPPVIVPIGGTLCAQPFSNAYTWFLDGVAIGTGTCNEPSAPGSYTVRLIAPGVCAAASAPYHHLPTATQDPGTSRACRAYLTGDGLLQVDRPADLMATHWRLTDAQGRFLRSGAFPTAGPLQVRLEGLPAGILLFQPMASGRPCASATRLMMR